MPLLDGVKNYHLRGKSRDGKIRQNPPFDRRIRSITNFGGTNGGEIQKGMIRTEDWKFALNFLYNPSTVDVSHSMDEYSSTTPMPYFARDKNNIGNPVVPLASSVGFSLLFDRTYELWDASLRTTPAGQKGVYVDVKALYDMLGMTAKDESGNNLGDAIVSPMIYTPVHVLFGGAANSLKYYGVIQSASITYTHWNSDMIPSRCAVTIGMNLLPTMLFDSAFKYGDPEYGTGSDTNTDQQAVANHGFKGARGGASSRPLGRPGIN